MDDNRLEKVNDPIWLNNILAQDDPEPTFKYILKSYDTYNNDKITIDYAKQ